MDVLLISFFSLKVPQKLDKLQTIWLKTYVLVDFCQWSPLYNSGNLFLPAAKHGMDGVWPSSYNILEIVAIRGQKSMVTYVIEVTELNFEVRCDL